MNRWTQFLGWPEWLLAAVFFAGFFWMLMRWRRASPSAVSPRGLRRYHRISLCLITPLVVLQVYSSVKDANYWMAAICLSILPMIAYSAYKHDTPAEALTNYAADPKRCGRCEYDLTGNVSGVCPECGWEIPRDLSRIERADWAMWWRKWDIEYLATWPRKLLSVGFFALAFLGLAVWVFLFRSPVLATLPGFMCLAMSINCVRIIEYARRRRLSDQVES